MFANPEDPPYSLLALPILWPEVSWDISYHVHSTVLKDMNALEIIKVFKNVTSQGSNKIVKVFVIWQYSKFTIKLAKRFYKYSNIILLFS